MSRTGVRIRAEKKSQLIRLELFREDQRDQPLAVMLDSTQTIGVINQLLRATEKLDNRPDKSAVKTLLIEALKSFDTSSDI